MTMEGRLGPPLAAEEEVWIMPIVRVRRAFRRGDNGQICRRGTKVDVPAKMAKHLIDQGYAEAVEAEEQKSSEQGDKKREG